MVGNAFFINGNDALTSIGGFDSLASVGGHFDISENNVFTSIGGFGGLEMVGRNFWIGADIADGVNTDNPLLTTIDGFYNLAWFSALGSAWKVQDVTCLCPSFELTTATDPSCAEQ